MILLAFHRANFHRANDMILRQSLFDKAVLRCQVNAAKFFGQELRMLWNSCFGDPPHARIICSGLRPLPSFPCNFPLPASSVGPRFRLFRWTRLTRLLDANLSASWLLASSRICNDGARVLLFLSALNRLMMVVTVVPCPYTWYILSIATLLASSLCVCNNVQYLVCTVVRRNS